MNVKLVLYILGGMGLVSGAIMLISFNPLFDFILKKQLVLTEDSFSYDMWKELPEDLKMFNRLYYYNVTNYLEVEESRGQIKPLIEEFGPYIWRERHLKENIVWNNGENATRFYTDEDCFVNCERYYEEITTIDNGTVTYQQKKIWEFMEEETLPLTLDDTIVNINMIALSATEYARTQANPFFIDAIDGMMDETGAGMFLISNVRNFTFEGIVDPMITDAIEADMGLPIKYDKFGWFYPRNDSLNYDGTYSMWTGATSIDKVGQISEWNFFPKIDEAIYPDKCGELTGSAGEFFPPGRGKDYVDFFSPDLCRSIRFEYDEKTNVEGASGYKYKLGKDFVSNSTCNPENGCYNPSPAPDHNLPNGFHNVTACKFQAPAYISYPHFMDVDPMIIDQFHEDSKFNPDPEKHTSYLSLDPRSGIPLEVAIRLQINMLARPLTHTEEYNGTNYTISVKAFDDLPPTFYPVIWFETVTKIDGSTDLGKQVILVTKLPMIMYGVGGAITAIGFLVILIGVSKSFQYQGKRLV